jgi:hypothetical protein
MKKNAQLALIETPKEEQAPQLKSWALVEIFGHQRMVRVDVPDLLKDGKIERRGFTRYFGRAAIYGVTPIDEETVRKMLPNIDGSPGAARPYSLRDDY